MSNTRKHDPSWVFNIEAFNRAIAHRCLNPNRVETQSGIDHGSIYRLQQGKIRNPTSATLLSIADTLEMDPRDLMIRQW